MSDECPKCGQNRNEHEFAVPAPYCPTAIELPSSTGSDATIKRLLAVLDGLIQECEYSATSGLPFNFPEGKGRWTQLENAKALLANLRQNDAMKDGATNAGKLEGSDTSRSLPSNG